jgi:hypothetical protein
MKGRAQLFLVSKQNLNPSSSHIWHINNGWKRIRNEKVIAPPSKGVKNSETETIEHYKGLFPITQNFLVCCSVAIRVQKLVVEL